MNRTFMRRVLMRCTGLVFTLAAVLGQGATLPAGFVDVVVATGFTNVSCMDIAPDGRVFVGQQNGVVRVVKNGALLTAPFVSLGANITNERGLVGLAVDPGFGTNSFVYVHYTTNAGASVVQRVSRFVANGDVALIGSETVLIETDPFTGNAEVGGGLAFGPDGMLYVGIGQCGLQTSVQTTNNLYGKILRLQRDGTIPSDNPFFAQNTGKNRAVWALGLRNPFVIAFQPGTGRLFINDVGSFMAPAREEINHGLAGANYGWPTCEGGCAIAGLQNPVYFYPHTNNLNAITGGAFYNPAAALYPTQYVGKYFWGDLNTATIQLLDPATTNASPFASRLVGGLVNLKVGPDGVLYYLVQSVSGPAGGAGMVGKIIPGTQTLFPLGAAWKYLDTGTTNLPASWTQLAFDDSTWSNGVAQFGYGDGGEATPIRSTGTNATRIITTYFRKAFVLSNAEPYGSFVVSLVRDDGAVVYLNGVEIFRSNLPAGAITGTTLAPVATANSLGADEESATFGVVVERTLMVTGTNVLAVEIHQQSSTSSDVSFDLALRGISAVPMLGATSAGSDIVLRYPSWASGFTLESAATLPATTWNTVTNLATASDGLLQVTVGASETQQFFRLRSP